MSLKTSEDMSIKYKTYHLTLEQKTSLLCRAREVCYNWWVDTLDCSKSFCRQKIEMSFEEVMGKYDGSELIIIHRDFLENYLEIGFRSGRDVEYFLWLMLDVKYIPEFTDGMEIL